MKYLLKTFLRVLCWGAAVLAPGAGFAEGQPNIIIILSDDMGYSDIGAYGGEIRTPELDRLAREGRQFTQFYNSARCCPSRASLMTGLYPHQAGIGHLIYPTIHSGYGDRLSKDSITIAEVLQEAGYGTYMSGKWHLAPRSYDPVLDVAHWPTRRGFDAFYGTIAGSGSFWDPSTLCRNETFITPENDPVYQPETFYYTDAITDNALMFLQQNKAEDAERPFFLYLSYTAAHWPLHVPEEEMAAYEGRYDGGYEEVHAKRVERLRGLGLVPEVSGLAEPVGDWDAVVNKEVEASLMEAYAAMVTRMDTGIGQIMDYLEETGQSANTLVFYLQDNGACSEDWFGAETTRTAPYEPLGKDTLQTSYRPVQTRDGRPVRMGPDVIPGPADTYTAYKENWANVSNAPFRKYKHYVHEGGISSPLVVHWPEGLGTARGQQRLVREPAHLIDIMATCLDAAGVAYPEARSGVALQPLAGVSLLPAMVEGGAPIEERLLFWEHEGNRAVRRGQWKLVALDSEPWELYDLGKDRGEMQDLSMIYPRVVAELAGEWYAWAQRSQVLPLGGWMDLDDGRVALDLQQGESLSPENSPLLKGEEVTVSLRVLGGPLEGVLLWQGTEQDGYALTIDRDRLSLTMRNGGVMTSMEMAGLPKAPFTIRASIAANGRARLSVDDRRIDGRLGKPFGVNPDGGLFIGHTGEALGKEGGQLLHDPFAGQLGFVTLRGAFGSASALSDGKAL